MDIYSEIYSCYRLFNICTRPKVIGGIHDVGSIHRSKIAYFSPMIRSQCPQKAAQEEEEKEKNKDIKQS